MVDKETDNKLRTWMAKNTYTIIFLGIMFVITWILLLLIDFGVKGV